MKPNKSVKVAEGVFQTEDGKFQAVLEIPPQDLALIFDVPVESLTSERLGLLFSLSRHLELHAFRKVEKNRWISVSVPMRDLERIPAKRLEEILVPFKDTAVFYPHPEIEQAIGKDVVRRSREVSA